MQYYGIYQSIITVAFTSIIRCKYRPYVVLNRFYSFISGFKPKTGSSTQNIWTEAVRVGRRPPDGSYQSTALWVKSPAKLLWSKSISHTHVVWDQLLIKTI